MVGNIPTHLEWSRVDAIGGYVLPKIDLEAGRVKYMGALPKVLASFGLSAQHAESGLDPGIVPKVKANSEKKKSGRKATPCLRGPKM